ncbi:hypothetical protein HYX19_05290 [Candidatus Woesearchaeota archaeon]|nr:hypothetical protein [Candidatus Woesearchaeota archaeon]
MKAMKGMKGGMVCDCPHHKIFGVGKALVFVLLGLAFLYPDWQNLVGYLLILFGIFMFFAKWCKCCDHFH